MESGNDRLILTIQKERSHYDKLWFIIVASINTGTVKINVSNIDMLMTADNVPASNTIVGAVIGVVSTISIIFIGLILFFIVR